MARPRRHEWGTSHGSADTTQVDLHGTSGGCARARAGRWPHAQAPAAPGTQLSALAPDNLAKPRPKAAVRPHRELVHRQQPRHPGLAVRPGDDSQAHAGGAEAPRRLREGDCRRKGLPRRHRPVLAGRRADHHDPRVADRDDPDADRDLHGQRVHEQPADGLPRRPQPTPIPTSSCAPSTASRSGAGKATRWSSRPRTSSTTSTTGWIRACRPAASCASWSASAWSMATSSKSR